MLNIISNSIINCIIHCIPYCIRNFILYSNKMSEKLVSQPQPIVKIGHYTLGQTLGVGTFGKVKSMYSYI